MAKKMESFKNGENKIFLVVLKDGYNLEEKENSSNVKKSKLLPFKKKITDDFINKWDQLNQKVKGDVYRILELFDEMVDDNRHSEEYLELKEIPFH